MTSKQKTSSTGASSSSAIRTIEMHRSGIAPVALLGAATVLVFFGATADNAAAKVHALVIGINDYDGPPKLKGAVNDANDVAKALRAGGTEDVTELVDKDATRENAFAAWEAMVKNSKPGDLLVFHFAGHGINVADQNGDEEDGQDESYLFVGFDEERHPDQQLIDDELDAWLKQAGDAGRKVLFVADACHSGSPTRSVFGETLPTRFYRPRTEPERPRPLVAGDVPEAATRDYVFSVGATLDNRTVPEIMIDDAPRGALSYAVARAFEGGADLDRDGEVVASEFTAFVRQSVRSLAASKQTPQFDVPDEGLRIIDVVGVPVAPQSEGADGIPLHIRPGADPALIAAVSGFDGVSLVDDESAAKLVFDPATGSLANNVRDVVAEGLDAAGLKTAIDADRALSELQQLALRGALPIAFSPNDGVQPEGTRIEFTVPGVEGRYLTVFDLTATGSVQFLWPTGPEDRDPISDSEFSLAAAVTPPFGADNLVVLSTESAPASLRDELKRLDGGNDPSALMTAIDATLSGQPYQMGIQAFFTRRK
jgi:uncharacterized caspase-like protein